MFGITKSGPNRPLYEAFGAAKAETAGNVNPLKETKATTQTRKWKGPPNTFDGEKERREMRLTSPLRRRLIEEKLDTEAALMKNSTRATVKDESFRHGFIEEMAKKRYSEIEQEVDRGAADEFNAWLLGFGSEKDYKTYAEAHGGPDVKAGFRKNPLSSHASVTAYFDKQVDARLQFEKFLAKLKLRYESSGSLENATIDECWLYYKYIIKGLQPTDDEIMAWHATAAHASPDQTVQQYHMARAREAVVSHRSKDDADQRTVRDGGPSDTRYPSVLSSAYGTTTEKDEMV